MGGIGSGAKMLPAEVHIARGTFRRDRHGKASQPDVPLSRWQRSRTLDGLPPAARRQAAELLEAFEGWDASSRFTLRLYVLSCSRLTALQALAQDKASVRSEVRREIATNMVLLKSLGLERPRW